MHTLHTILDYRRHAALQYVHLNAIFCDIHRDVYGLELVFWRLHHL